MNTSIWRDKTARRLIQAAFLGFVLYVGVGRQLNWGLPTIDALCPFGAVEGLWYLVTSGRYLGKIFPSNMILGIGLVVTVILAAGAFCGWICPFGTLQDGLSSLGRRLRLPAIRIPAAREKVLSHIRFVVLGGILWLTIVETELVFATICPYRTIFGWDWLFDPGALAWSAYAVAGGILIGSLFISRFWCRFLCPLGAVISVLARFSLVRVKRVTEQCTDCGLCREACPMNLARPDRAQPDPACTFCLECTQACPRPETLMPALRWPRLSSARLSRLAPLAAVAVFVGAIVLGDYTGWWKTSGMSAAYFGAVASGQRLEPEDIRGWMSLEQVSLATGVPLDHFYVNGDLPADVPANTPLSELEKMVGFETDDARRIVVEYYMENPDTQPQPSQASPPSKGQRSEGQGQGQGQGAGAR